MTQNDFLNYPKDFKYQLAIKVKDNPFIGASFSWGIDFDYDKIDFSGKNGVNGNNGFNSVNDSYSGGYGIHGENGKNAIDREIDVAFYKYHDEIMIILYDVNQNKIFLTRQKKLSILNNGGDGGCGGNGGNGGDGVETVN